VSVRGAPGTAQAAAMASPGVAVAIRRPHPLPVMAAATDSVQLSDGCFARHLS